MLVALVAERGFSRPAVYRSLTRRVAREDSDIDLLVETPAGTSTFESFKSHQLIEQVHGRKIDLVDYGGLFSGIDDDVRCEPVLL